MHLGPFHILVIAAAIGLAGCETDADRIRSLNQDPNTLSAEIDAVEIEDGDCINSTLPEGVDVESVVIVPCSGTWQYRAVDSFKVANGDQYPGDEYFSRKVYERCDTRYTFFLTPSAESWEWGDREIICLQESFGLSATDPAKLDRLVRFEGLSVGDCFNEAPESGDLLVERVDCSQAWESRVLRTFQVEASEHFPGQSSLDKQAYETCDPRSTQMSSPEAQTWAMGDRTIICLQESFGLSGTDPAKLDRLIKLERLKVGDCFNEAPETDGLLVERIDCSEAWELRVLDSFDVEGTGRYPGGSFFDQLTYGTCDKRSTTTRLPSGDTWALGDRTVICLQESFGLSATDPGKLDHLIGIDGLDVGDCFNEAAETEHVLVERVDCSGAWESRIVAIFTDPSNDDFPGDAYFQAQATLECGPSWDYYYPPSPESWSLGDRNVVCVRDS